MSGDEGHGMVCVVTLMWFVGEGKGVQAWVERLFCRRWSQEAWMAWRDVTRVLGRGRWDWRATAPMYQEIPKAQQQSHSIINCLWGQDPEFLMQLSSFIIHF
jgi:hypothetical protein